MANLNLDVQLAEGIRLNLVTYLSSRHHNEAWVKGGYIQFDKLPFKGAAWDKIMELATIKIGHMEINYGDAHFRRSDGGQTIYNPFIENYILDAFATEIGGEVLLQKNGLFGMVGITNGMIKGNIDSLVKTPQDDNVRKSPSVYAKAGFDRTIMPKLRVRGSASVYYNASSGGNTLYGGDRAGSNYFMVMEKAGGTYAGQAFSGRITSCGYCSAFRVFLKSLVIILLLQSNLDMSSSRQPLSFTGFPAASSVQRIVSAW